MIGDINAARVYVELQGIKPKVWRRLLVPADWTLTQLHHGLQAAFGWCDAHLHEFDIGGLRYGDVDVLTDGAFEDDPKVFDASAVRLRDFRAEAAFYYTYDFGDNWRHWVKIEERLSLTKAPAHAECAGGAGARPPEDVGGTSGYERFLEILADPDEPEHRETKRWCGGHFDPAWCDVAIVSKDLRSALRSNRRVRLVQPKPKRSRAIKAGSV